MSDSIVVYFTDGEGNICGEKFDGPIVEILTTAMKRTEALRNEGNRHVSMSVENSNSVGKPGVDVTGVDYNWKKRRI